MGGQSKFLDPDFLARVKPITLQRYKSAALAVTSWAQSQGYAPEQAEDWDDLLFEFKHAHPQLTRPKFVQAVAAIEFFVPKLKKNLPWAHACLSGWHKRSSVRHTVPLTSKPAKLMAIHMANRGKKRLGLGLVLQTVTGMRPNELLHILPEHVLFPEDQGDARAKVPVVIALGVKAGTKSGRSQTVMIKPEHAELWKVLKACRNSTPPGMFMFPFTITSYRNEIRAVERLLKVSVGWGPHSPRAGYATESRRLGIPFEEIREGGRWLSDSSLRTYLDIVSAASVVRALRLNGLAVQLEQADRFWPLYFA